MNGKFNSVIKSQRNIFKKKNKQIETSPNKSNLDQVLWFIENYLPQKKDRDIQKKFNFLSLSISFLFVFS